MKKVLLAWVILLSTCQFLIAQSIRVEPPSWWIGMKNPKLQLLIYADKATEHDLVMSYPGLKIMSITKVKSPNYLFVDLVIGPDAKPGSFDIELRKKGKAVHKFTYKLEARDPASSSRKGFDPSDVMYLITPDRFVNGNTANDNVKGMPDTLNRKNPGGRHGGDIQGIVNSLDYIKNMGFTSIWVNPVLENDQLDYSYHGYATTDFYQVDARYGTNEEYRALAKQAKDKGIKLIMDMIVNHCGDMHWWMNDLPTEDWINFDSYDDWMKSKKGYTITNHRREVIQDPYASKIDRQVHADGWFVPTMPDLNQRNPFMANYLTQNTIWWIEYAHLAGIRMDTYSYPNKEYMSEWTRAVMEEYPYFNIVGEEWTDRPSLVSFWQKGKKNPNGYTSSLPSLMDFPLQSILASSIQDKESMYNSGLIMLYRMLSYDFLYPSPYDLVIFPDNHDMSRIYTQLNEDVDNLKIALAYLLVTRGTPQIYYGTEALLGNKGTDDHGIIRSDFPGGWAGDKVNMFTGEGLSEQQKDVQGFLKKMLNWRKVNPVIHTGKLTHFAPENGVYVLFRYDGSKKVMFVINKNTSATSLELGRFSEMLQGTKQGKDVVTEKTFPTNGANMELPAKSALVLELE